MRNLEFTGIYLGETIKLKQVSKPNAKKLFNQGTPVLIQSSNFHPLGVWSQAVELDEAVTNFDQFVNSFKYYNCSNESGKYVTYYQKLKY